MASFLPPYALDAPTVSDEMDAVTRALFRFYGNGRPRGRTVLKVAGVYSTVDTPTQVQIEACDLVTAPDGTQYRGAYLGGHQTPVTSAEQTALTNAGYGAGTPTTGYFI